MDYTIVDVPTSVSGGVQSYPAGWALTAALGDSLTRVAWSMASNDLSYAASGWLAWAMALSRGALWCPFAGVPGATVPLVNYNRAVSGETAEQARARVPELLTLPVLPKYCAIAIGTNNLTINTSQTSASIANAMLGICTDLLAIGVTPILSTLLPRGNGTAAGWGSLTSGQISTARTRLLEVNALLRAAATREPRIILADVFSSILNLTSATSDPDAVTVYDWLHTTDIGAMRIGIAWWRDVSRRITPPVILTAGAADAYATTSQTGNLLTSSHWGATGGTAGAGVTGDVPSTWSANRFEGTLSSAATNLRARVDSAPGNELVVAVTGTDAAAFRFYPASTSINASDANGWADGDGLYGELSVDILAGGSCNHLPNPYIRFASASVQMWAMREVYTANPAGAMTLTLRTPIAVRSGGGFAGTDNSAQGWLRVPAASGVIGSVVLRNPAWRRYDKSAPGALSW